MLKDYNSTTVRVSILRFAVTATRAKEGDYMQG